MYQGQGWPSRETIYAPRLWHLHSPLFTQGIARALGGLDGSLPKDGTGNKGLEDKTKNDHTTFFLRYLASVNTTKCEPLRSDEQ
jgi:hypothetical protein